MKALIQRVTEAQVAVDGRLVGSIGRGILAFLAVEKGDSEKDLDLIVRKIASLRIFYDDQGRMNLSIRDVSGELLLISQFTLAADCRKGNRPSFDAAEEPSKAEAMYLQAAERLKAEGLSVATGVFAAHMQVSLINDGPVTFMLDSSEAIRVRSTSLTI